jgi:hypothetical protein
MLKSDQVIHHNKPVYYGEYPDPNNLKTHGDIGYWTDQKFG